MYQYRLVSVCYMIQDDPKYSKINDVWICVEFFFLFTLYRFFTSADTWPTALSMKVI